jgi:hypothetical protein
MSSPLHRVKLSLLHHPTVQCPKASLLHRLNLFQRARPSHPSLPGDAQSRSCAAARPNSKCEPAMARNSTKRTRSLAHLSTSRRQLATQPMAGRSISCGIPEHYGLSCADRLRLASGPTNPPPSHRHPPLNGSTGSGTACCRPAAARTRYPRRLHQQSPCRDP